LRARQPVLGHRRDSRVTGHARPSPKLLRRLHDFSETCPQSKAPPPESCTPARASGSLGRTPRDAEESPRI
jgi:hypothetical protein